MKPLGSFTGLCMFFILTAVPRLCIGEEGLSYVQPYKVITLDKEIKFISGKSISAGEKLVILTGPSPSLPGKSSTLAEQERHGLQEILGPSGEVTSDWKIMKQEGEKEEVMKSSGYRNIWRKVDESLQKDSEGRLYKIVFVEFVSGKIKTVNFDIFAFKNQ